MVSRKQIWDSLDELEGKKKGSSYKRLTKELERQGYSCKIGKNKFKCLKKKK